MSNYMSTSLLEFFGGKSPIDDGAEGEILTQATAQYNQHSLDGSPVDGCFCCRFEAASHVNKAKLLNTGRIAHKQQIIRLDVCVDHTGGQARPRQAKQQLRVTHVALPIMPCTSARPYIQPVDGNVFIKRQRISRSRMTLAMVHVS